MGSPPERQVGYHGKVTLVSPRGDQEITIVVPYRFWLVRGSSSVVSHAEYEYKRAGARFRRLLSRGWRVVENGEPTKTKKKKDSQDQQGNGPGQAGPKKPEYSEGQKDQTGKDQKKGSAQKDQDGQKGDKGTKEWQGRGSRGARRRRKKFGRSKEAIIMMAQSPRRRGGVVRSPQPIQINKDLLKSAEESAGLLAELVGRSALKTPRNVTVNVQAFLVALETGDNPLPPLESTDERPKPKVLVTPDCSGSTANWNGLGQAWAIHLSNLPDVDVAYVMNYNGRLDGWIQDDHGEWCEVATHEDIVEILGRLDIVIYLGDGDGFRLCRSYATTGVTVVALDNSSSHSSGGPRQRGGKRTTQNLFWVDRVTPKDPATWAEAVRVCLK